MVTVIICVKVASNPRKVPKEIGEVFRLYRLEGLTVEEKNEGFIQRVENEGGQRVFDNLIRFMQFHLARVHNKGITGATLRNYLKGHKTILRDERYPYNMEKNNQRSSKR